MVSATPTFVAPAPGADEESEARIRKIVEAATLLRLWNDPPTLDPHVAGDTTSAAIIVEVFGGLVTIDPNLEIVPDLAEAWDIGGDGRSYTFRLRKGASFHNGKPVTAHAFKWSLERAADPATESPVADTYLGDIVGFRQKLKGQAQDISGVRVIDDHSLAITIDAPKAYLLSKLTYPTAFVVDQDNVMTSRRWYMKPNGTGPFSLDQYIPQDVLVLKRNQAYHLGVPGWRRCVSSSVVAIPCRCTLAMRST